MSGSSLESCVWIKQEIETFSKNLFDLASQSQVIQNIANSCVEALKNGKKIMFCGNGGSAADSQHLAAELVGRYKKERNAINAVALTVDTSILTAIGNDYGYDDVFRRQVEGIGQEGDILIGLSTSGNSRNVVRAFEQAKKMGITTIAFTGSSGGNMKTESDICLAVPATVTNHIQEQHIISGHIVCELIENSLYD